MSGDVNTENTRAFMTSALADRRLKGPNSKVYRLVDKQLRKRSDVNLTRQLFDAVAHHAAQIAGHAGGMYNDLVDAVFTFDFGEVGLVELFQEGRHDVSAGCLRASTGAVCCDTSFLDLFVGYNRDVCEPVVVPGG